MPEVRWTFDPATDPASVEALRMRGIRELRISSVDFTERPDGSIGFVVNGDYGYVVSREGAFEWLGTLPGVGGRALRSWVAVDADWLAQHSFTALDSIYAITGPELMLQNWTRDLGLSEAPTGGGPRLPIAADRSGAAFWPAGTNWIASSCATSEGFHWLIEIDTGGLAAAGPRSIDGAAPRILRTDMGEIVVSVGTREMYVFSEVGESIATMSATGEGEHDPRHLLGYVPGCGTYVIAGTNLELWSPTLERRARWSRLCEGSLTRFCADHRLVSPAFGCGTFVHSGDPSNDSVRALDADGAERWRAPAPFPVSPLMPLADGGVLVVMETDLLRLGPDGAETWRWPLPPELGHVVPSTAILTEDGMLFFAVEPALGAYIVVAVATNALPGPMAWFESGANPRRDGYVAAPAAAGP